MNGEGTTGAVMAARAAIGESTPLLYDCGLCCGSACCAADQDGQGFVYLFPGEDALCEGGGFATMPADAFAPMLVCHGACDRAARPLACRFFPLTPAFGRDGAVFPIMDRRAFAMCPLAPRGRRALNPEFVRRVRAAFEILAKAPETAAFLRAWAREEKRFRDASL